MNNRYVQAGIVVLLIGLCFAVALVFPQSGGSYWRGRAIIGVLVAGAGLILPPSFALSVGILTIPADLSLIAKAPNALNSLDLLIWAGYVLLPLGLSRYREGASSDVQQEQEPSTDDSQERDPVAETPKNVDLHPEVADQTDPAEHVQKLLVSDLRIAHRELETNNLVYFHVRDSEATPGYVVNDHGSINTDITVSSDQARGIGWVLRHDDELLLDDDRVDWRNLQYHSKPIDLERVLMQPVRSDNTLIGVVVFEWKNRVDYDDSVLEQFTDRIESLMSIDQSVRRMEKKEREVDLLKRLSELEPLSVDRIETLRQRIKDLVRELIPADHVEFVTEESDDDSNVLQQRRLFYEKCCEWISDRGETLRINNVANFSYKGRRIGNLAPPDASSFLGGALETDGNYHGFLCLDDSSESFFSSEDEALLDLVLRQTTGIMRVASKFSSEKRNRREINEWLEDIGAIQQQGLEDFASQFNQVVDRKLPIIGAGIFLRSAEGFSLLCQSDDLTLPEVLDSDSTLVSRIRDCENQVTVEFPNLRRLSGFGFSKGSVGMTVCPWFSGSSELEGMLCLLQEDVTEGGQLDTFRSVWPLVSDQLKLLRRLSEIEYRSSRDRWSQLPAYDSWKRNLGSWVSGEVVDQLSVWNLRVPGFESVIESRGRQRAEKWIKSLTNRLRKEFDSEQVTRAYGSVFYGCLDESDDTVRERLKSVCADLKGWSFPAGDWPDDPKFSVLSFQRPFPEIEAMVETAKKETLTNRQRDEESKEPAADGV